MPNNVEELMENLLQKYAGGRLPPLVNSNNAGSGLIDTNLLQIYHSGLLSLHAIRLGFILSDTNSRDQNKRWENGDFSLNDILAKPSWGNYCISLRNNLAGDYACQQCDRRWAARAEAQGATIAYICDGGLIDFASPVKVMDQVVAVLFCGQHKPLSGTIWHPEFTYPNGQFRALAEGQIGVDAWQESQKRIRQSEALAGYEHGDLEGKLLEEVQTRPATEISPQHVQEIIDLMNAIGEQLSALATSTFELEKNRLVGWIRGHIARSLAPLSLTRPETSSVWLALSATLRLISRYFGLDYAFIFSCGRGSLNNLELKCQFGLPDQDFPTGPFKSNSPKSMLALASMVCSRKERTQIVLKEFKEDNLFNWLNQQHSRKHSSRAMAFPLTPPHESTDFPPPVLFLGRFDRDLDINAYLPNDRQALDIIIKDISLVSEVVMLVEQLEEKARQQSAFLEDVAHDIRNPIQIIINQAEVMAAGLVSTGSAPRLAQKLATQARRLHLMSQRVWTLGEIDRGHLLASDVEKVSAYEVIAECRKTLNDLAEQREIKIILDPLLKNWPPLWVNKALFHQTVLNLVDNAIKYSRDNTEIRIDGKRSTEGYTLYFVNRGILIREDDKNQIFSRYFRTNEAKSYRQQGTGIGLYIVKVFADKYGDIKVKSLPIPGSRDFVTTFELFIREREH